MKINKLSMAYESRNWFLYRNIKIVSDYKMDVNDVFSHE